MRKLLSAGIYRLTRSWLFWAITAYAALCGVVFGVFLRRGGIEDMLLMAFWIGFAVLISLSVGREHHDSTLRNKLVAGHTRGRLLLSEILLHAGACTAWAAICALIAGLIGGASYFSHFPWHVAILTVVGFLLCSMTVGVLMTVLCLLLPQRGVGPILCILLVIGLSLGSYATGDVLTSPEYYLVVDVDENGVETERLVQNESYVGEPLRSVFNVLHHVNPFSLHNHVSHADFYYIYDYEYVEGDAFLVPQLDRCERAIALTPLCMAGLTGIVGAVGYTLFRRKDLK